MSHSFVVDSMLGDLARWLRILGYSTFYDPGASDEHLLRVAEAERSVLLTRDRELYAKAVKRGVKAHLLPGDLGEALLLLRDAHGVRLRIDLSNSLCPVCNGRLRRARGEEVEGLVPAYIARRYDLFLVCESCGHVYWPGSHHRNMTRFLESLGKR